MSRLLLLFIAYAPWHDALFLGDRKIIGSLGPLKNITTSGALNVFWIGLVGFCALFLIASVSVRFRWLDFLLLAYPVFTVLNTRLLDTPAVIAIENSLLFTLLFLLLLRKEQIQLKIGALSRFALVVFGFSYGLGLFLPMFTGVGQIYMKYEAFTRYSGWVGEGTALAISGWALATLAAIGIASEMKWWKFLLMGLGFLGIFLNIHRTSLVALTLGVAILFVICLNGKKKQAVFFGFFVLVAAVTFLSGPFARKSNFSWARVPDQAVVSADAPNAAAPPPRVYPGFESLDWVIVTNGRQTAFKYFVKRLRAHWLFGLGTGAVPRLLRENAVFFSQPIGKQTMQPQCDYLRVLAEHGVLGLLFFLSAAGCLLYRLRWSAEFIFVFPLFVSLATENMLVFPTFGYGLLLVCALSAEPFRASVSHA